MMLERFQRERKGGTYYYFGVSVSPHAQLELDQEEWQDHCRPIAGGFF